MQHPFLFGVIAALSWVIATFFFKFYKKSSDRLFLIFSVAFVLLGLERLTLVMYGSMDTPRSLFYLFRLFAFALITYGVIDKNRRSSNEN
jgi:hypothetical protein